MISTGNITDRNYCNPKVWSCLMACYVRLAFLKDFLNICWAYCYYREKNIHQLSPRYVNGKSADASMAFFHFTKSIKHNISV